MRCIPSQVCFEPLTSSRTSEKFRVKARRRAHFRLPLVLPVVVATTSCYYYCSSLTRDSEELECSARSAEPWCGWRQGRRNGGTGSA
jgi:hypothetical protein